MVTLTSRSGPRLSRDSATSGKRKSQIPPGTAGSHQSSIDVTFRSQRGETAGDGHSLIHHGSSITADTTANAEMPTGGTKPRKGGRIKRRVFPTIGHRNAMGEFVPEKGCPPLSSLGRPLPGPLDYTPKLPSTGKEFSILGKPTTLKTEVPIGPGPANYDVRESLGQHAPGPHLGARIERRDVVNESPGPLYNVTRGDVGTEGRNATISGRFTTQEIETPGPNKYLTASDLGHAPAFTMGHRFINLPESHPGPTDYDVHYPTKRKAPSTVISSRHAEVFDLKEAASVPAPNYYDPIPEQSRLAATLKGRPKERKILETPGPANYIVPETIHSGPQYTLVGRYVPYEDEPYYPSQPGPGDYEPRDDLTKQRAVGVTISALKYATKVEQDAPGPGSYTCNVHTVKSNASQKATLKGRWKTYIDSTPGPGYYNLPTTIGDQRRPPKGLHLPPQPTSIRMSTKVTVDASASATESRAVGSAGGSSFPSSSPPSSSSPLKLPETSKSPGPAQYSVDSKCPAIGRRGPAASLGAKIKDREPDVTPGPDAYDLNAAAAKRRNGPSLKGRPSPYIMVFPTMRLSRLKVQL